MGWGNAHLHEFRTGRVSFGEPSPDYLGKMLDAKTDDDRDLVEWAGDFDPDEFDLEAINTRLKEMR